MSRTRIIVSAFMYDTGGADGRSASAIPVLENVGTPHGAAGAGPRKCGDTPWHRSGRSGRSPAAPPFPGVTHCFYYYYSKKSRKSRLERHKPIGQRKTTTGNLTPARSALSAPAAPASCPSQRTSLQPDASPLRQNTPKNAVVRTGTLSRNPPTQTPLQMMMLYLGSRCAEQKPSRCAELARRVGSCRSRKKIARTSRCAR